MTKRCFLTAFLAAGLMASTAFGQNPFAPKSIEWTSGAPGSSTPGGGLDFPGVNGAYSFLDVPGLIRAPETDYTISLWFSTDQVGRESFAVGTRNQGIHHGLRQGNDGTANVGDHDRLHSAHWGADVRGTTVISTGDWHHAVWTHDAANDLSEMFIDGVSEPTGNFNAPAIGKFSQREPNQNDGNIIFGARNNGDAAWDGKLDDISVWSSILAPADIATLAGGGNPLDLTPVAYWPLDEGTGLTAADLSGNSLDGAFEVPPPPVYPAVPASAAVDPDSLNLRNGLATRWWKANTGNSLATARGIRDTDPHHATYLSATVDTNPGPANDHGQDEPIQTFADVQGSALDITQAGADAGIDASTTGQDSFWSFDGYIAIEEGDDVDPTADGIQVAFGIPSDDATDLIIGGVTILENDGGHGFNGPNPGPMSVDFEAAGLYATSLLLTQGGGGVGLELLGSMSSGAPIHDLGGLTDAVPNERLFSVVPEPSSTLLLGMSLGLLSFVRRRRR